MTAIQPTSSQSIALPHPDFEQLVEVVEKTVAALRKLVEMLSIPDYTDPA